MIERTGNVVTVTLKDEEEAERFRWISSMLLKLMDAGSLSSTPNPASPAGPSEPLKHRMPLSPATCAEIERREISRFRLREFDRIAMNPPGEAYLPPGRRK